MHQWSIAQQSDEIHFGFGMVFTRSKHYSRASLGAIQGRATLCRSLAIRLRSGGAHSRSFFRLMSPEEMMPRAQRHQSPGIHTSQMMFLTYCS
jgi:hypothetical protein